MIKFLNLRPKYIYQNNLEFCSWCQKQNFKFHPSAKLVCDPKLSSRFGYSWVVLTAGSHVNAVWILHMGCEVAFRLHWWLLNQMKSGRVVDKWTHLSSSSPFAQAEAAEDHYLPQRIHHTVTWPNGKHHIMTSIDPVTDFCPPPYTLAHLTSILLSAAFIYRCEKKKKKKPPSESPICHQSGWPPCHSHNLIVDK